MLRWKWLSGHANAEKSNVEAQMLVVIWCVLSVPLDLHTRHIVRWGVQIEPLSIEPPSRIHDSWNLDFLRLSFSSNPSFSTNLSLSANPSLLVCFELRGCWAGNQYPRTQDIKLVWLRQSSFLPHATILRCFAPTYSDLWFFAPNNSYHHCTVKDVVFIVFIFLILCWDELNPKLYDFWTSEHQTSIPNS